MRNDAEDGYLVYCGVDLVHTVDISLGDMTLLRVPCAGDLPTLKVNPEPGCALT